jgi:hypothetical protein
MGGLIMKVKVGIVALLLVTFFILSSFSYADNYKRGKEDDHIVRILAYAVHPFGMAVEYTVTRPIHWITKQVHLNKIFGSDNTFEDKSFVWE